MSYQSYAVTLRPRGGVTDTQVEYFDLWASKTCDYHVIVTEKLDKERHIHAALFLKACTTRSNLNNRILSIKDINLDATEKKVLRQGTRIMYNDDFFDKYMDKEDDTQVISENLPDDREVLQAYYPEVGDKRASKEFKGSVWYLNCEKLWYEYEGYPFTVHLDYRHVSCFLHQLMFVDRKIEVIDDPRKLAAKTAALLKFIECTTRDPLLEIIAEDNWWDDLTDPRHNIN